MKVEMKILGIAASLVAIPVLMALPQSMLISDVTLRQDAAPDKQVGHVMSTSRLEIDEDGRFIRQGI